MLLWKHECSRVFSDRFTIQVDKDWFNKALYDLAEEVLGLEYKKMMDCEPVFVDFMRLVVFEQMLISHELLHYEQWYLDTDF